MCGHCPSRVVSLPDIGAGRLVTSPGWRFACQLPPCVQGCHGTESATGQAEGANVKAELETA